MVKKSLIFLLIILGSFKCAYANKSYNWNNVILAIADIESGYDEKIVSPFGKFVGLSTVN